MLTLRIAANIIVLKICEQNKYYNLHAIGLMEDSTLAT